MFQTWGYYGFGTLAPIVLVAKGYSIVDSLLFSALTFLGYPLGSALSIPLVERIERKYLLIGAALVMAGCGLAFGLAESTSQIVAFGFLYTVASNVFSNAYHIYQAEVFPTHLRATAASSIYALSRRPVVSCCRCCMPTARRQAWLVTRSQGPSWRRTTRTGPASSRATR
jgi:MFS transporter, putative metabolite:H+ symporter